MANLTRFNPFNELMRHPLGGMNELFEQMESPFLRGMPAAPRIKMDVVEKDKAYEVRADIPGAKKEDIRVSVEGNTVTISADVKQEEERKDGERVVQSERYFGRASRSFTLDREIDEEKAVARYENGVLQLQLPVREGVQARRNLQIQ